MRACIAGCGALGSWIGLYLARPNLQFLLVDDDRISEGNIATSAFYHHHVGAYKTTVLGEMMWRKGQCETVLLNRTLVTPSPLRDCELVIDTFDNVQARALTCGRNTVHVGVSADRTGSVVWDDVYTLPPATFERGTNPICTHELGRPILRFTAAVAAGVIEDYLESGRRRSVFVTENLQIVE